jgi:hypothetical protein
MPTQCHVIGTSKCRCASKQKSKLISGQLMLRALWSDHSIYTARYIEAAIFRSATATAYLDRLLENQKEIGFELGKFSLVGRKNGKTVGELLTAHIQKAGGVVSAALKHQDLSDAINAFFVQGDVMAKAFAEVLRVSKRSLIKEFRTHNTHVSQLASMLLQNKTDKRYVKELDAYQNHMMHVADVIWEAIQ